MTVSINAQTTNIDNSENDQTTTSQKDSEVFTIVEQMPMFPGGRNAEKKFIEQNLVYPETALQNKIEGKVYVSFIVEKDGSITNIQIKSSPRKDFSTQAIRVIEKMPNWIPGRQRGKVKRVIITLRIRFGLDGKQTYPKPSTSGY